VTRLSRLAVPDTIFGRAALLALSSVLLLTAINVGIIFLRPPPRDVPLSSYEVARLMRGQPTAKQVSGISVADGRVASAGPATSKADRLIGTALAFHLHVPAGDVAFRHTSPLPPTLMHMEQQIATEARLYDRRDFDPIIFGEFTATARLPDGRWRTLARQTQDPGLSWQINTALRLMVAFLLVLPIAWWFASRLARPIRAFASAADRVGRDPGVAPVDVSGTAEIRLAANALNEMQDRLHRYVVERTGVVGAIAHDLRTPLARLRFHLSDAPEPMRAKAEVEIEEMQAMITATMEFVQNETRPRSSELLDLTLLVEGVVDDFADLGRRARMEPSDSATVRGDPLLLKRLFSNLVGNALTYGGEASVRLRRTGREAIVEVSDSGPGMRAEDLARAFEPFYRAEGSRNRQTGGIGLGLAIVSGAARAHGGDVELRNGQGGGLSATVRLPLD
jgi:signal transduction histidine kinase